MLCFYWLTHGQLLEPIITSLAWRTLTPTDIIIIVSACSLTLTHTHTHCIHLLKPGMFHKALNTDHTRKSHTHTLTSLGTRKADGQSQPICTKENIHYAHGVK